MSELFVTTVDWKTRVKPVLFAPETLLARKMMQQLMDEKRSMAIVLDEFGGTSGMVTLDLTEFNTSKVENANSMFKSMNALITIYASESFDTKPMVGSSWKSIP